MSVTYSGVTYKNDAEALKAMMAERDAALTAAATAKAEAEAAVKAAAEAASKPKGFRINVAKYSTKPNRQTGKVHPNAGKSKGVFEIFSCGSIYGINMAPDQWTEIKAHVAEIDAFVEANKSELVNMSAKLATYGKASE